MKTEGVSFSELTKRLVNLNFTLTSKDFFKKGLEVSKEGTVWKRNSANEEDPQMVKQSDDAGTTKLGRAIANKVKEQNPELFKDMTAKDDKDCDIRQSKKDENVYGVFADGDDEPSEVYHK
jgi:hypothetical protein